MKHIQFTLQFVVLLVAIPLLVFMQSRHDYSDKAKEKTQTESGIAYTEKSAASGDVFPSTEHLVLE